MSKPDHTFTRLFHLCHALRTAGLRDGIDFACTAKHGRLHVMCSQEASDKVKAAMTRLDTRPASVHIYGAPECPAYVNSNLSPDEEFRATGTLRPAVIETLLDQVRNLGLLDELCGVLDSDPEEQDLGRARGIVRILYEDVFGEGGY